MDKNIDLKYKSQNTFHKIILEKFQKYNSIVNIQNLGESQMSSEFEQNLEKYAEVILKIGLNLQRGQRLIIFSADFASFPLELASFIEVIVKQAYQMGARFIEVLWDDPKIHLIRLKHAPQDSFEEYPQWRRDAVLDFAEKGDAILGIFVANPDLFKDQAPEIISILRTTRLKYNKPISTLIGKNATNWLAISAPIAGWADKIFPDLPSDKRKAKLWDTIFNLCRIKEKDPLSAWKLHIKQLHARRDYLNNKQYIALKLKSPETELTVGLPKDHIWRGGSGKTKSGINFTANLPTEEIFTLPHKDKTEGVVTATKPLYLSGSYIEDFKLIFSQGKVKEATAVVGQEHLDRFIKTDEGASFLGEIALVPHRSPISQSGLLFYNSLYDENASCHIALGKAYRFCLENGEKMSDEEFIAEGGNDSITHIDFMIGSGEMDIDGITEDGTSEPIMRNGEWAFEV
jgi:aminopeptidase